MTKPMVKQLSGADMIAYERRRQVKQEGWDSTHDDMEHTEGELAAAACCYAAPWPIFGEYDPWPWDKESDKRNKHSRIRLLVIAGALIAAEIDRLKRAGVKA